MSYNNLVDLSHGWHDLSEYSANILRYAPPSVRTVTFGIGYDIGFKWLRNRVASLKWDALETLLLELDALEEVRVIAEYLDRRYAGDEFITVPEIYQQGIVKALPALHSRGQLRFPAGSVVIPPDPPDARTDP